MDRFIAAGGSFIDTANGSTAGHSEATIGDHISRHPLRRDRLVIATNSAAISISAIPTVAVQGGNRSSRRARTLFAATFAGGHLNDVTSMTAKLFKPHHKHRSDWLLSGSGAKSVNDLDGRGAEQPHKGSQSPLKAFAGER